MVLGQDYVVEAAELLSSAIETRTAIWAEV